MRAIALTAPLFALGLGGARAGDVPVASAAAVRRRWRLRRPCPRRPSASAW